MAQLTEAACLLDAGALYGLRVLLQPEVGDPIFAGIKAGAFSLYFGDAPIYHFDLEGRWQRAYINGLHELNGLDHVIQSIDRVREGENLVLHRRTRTASETTTLDEHVRQTASTLLGELDGGRYQRVDPPTSRANARSLSDDELRGWLSRISAWDQAAWSAQRNAYRSAYRGHPLLPPDCQNAVVLEATLGQADGRGFGGATGEDFHARTNAEFAEHALKVQALLGRRIEQCKSVFLAGPDALRQPADVVAGYLATIACTFPVAPGEKRADPSRVGQEQHALDGVHAFIDRFHFPLPGADALVRYRTLGLTRVSLGVESGDPDVRAHYGKDWTDEALRAFVVDLKSAGIGVGVMTLVGAGGREADARHAVQTSELLNSLELGKGDIVSLLDANELLAVDRERRPDSVPFTPLTGTDWSTQLKELKLLLVPLRTDHQVKIAPYSLGKQAGQSMP